MEIRAGGGVFGLGNLGGRGGQKTLPSVAGVWIFSGITHYDLSSYMYWCQNIMNESQAGKQACIAEVYLGESNKQIFSTFEVPYGKTRP